MVIMEKNATSNANYTSILNFIVEKHKTDYDELIALEAPGFKWESQALQDGDIRDLNQISVTYNSIKFTVDLESTMKLYAIAGVWGYISSGIALVAFVIYINSDLSKYVIYPLESMYEKVVILSRNPMAATNDDFATKAGISSLLQSNNKTAQDEIHLIDTSIMKIAYLLAVGYGEAGTGIIINNMKKRSGMDVDIPGQKIFGIYGFCDIRNFTDATEVLQTKVMTFVNKIASIVHINVVKTGGSNNKNIGDAFLYVWKIASHKENKLFATKIEAYLRSGEDDLNPEEKNSLQNISDLSVYWVLKVIAKINSYHQILAYREHEGLNERIPDYSVKMGYGLHLGWAIEGLIGSSHKVDASYLSPHVNLASRLEAATKQYGVNFLMSETIYMNLSESFRLKWRCVDRCTLKGVAKPMYLYTLETDIRNLPKVKDKYAKMTVKQRQKVVNEEKDILFEKIFPSKYIP